VKLLFNEKTSEMAPLMDESKYLKLFRMKIYGDNVTISFTKHTHKWDISVLLVLLFIFYYNIVFHLIFYNNFFLES